VISIDIWTVIRVIPFVNKYRTAMKNLILILTFALIFFACHQGKDKMVELETEVLAIHDEVMPRITEIMKLKSRLGEKISTMDSLQNEGISGNNLAAERMNAVDLNQRLTEADRMMWDWMHGYNADSAKKLKAEKSLLYFENEKKKILHVREFTLKSIQETKTYLDK
jgi:hypothetical protein